MNKQFSFFSQQMAVLAKEHEQRCRTLAANMARVNTFGDFCQTFNLAPAVRFHDPSELTLRSIGKDLHASERDALLAEIKRHGYEVGEARDEQGDLTLRTARKFSHSVSHGGHSFALVYWLFTQAEGL